MAEEDRLDPDKLWLWLDYETSSLDHSDLTALEFGYTITDRELTQLVPIQTRLCAFTSPVSETGVLTPADHNWDLWVGEVVRGMHVDSGLSADHRAALQWSIVNSQNIIDQLVFDDLLHVGWDGTSKIVLAGSGIAGFDRSVMQCLRSRILDVAHYRSADVSIALEVLDLSVPKTPESFEDVVSQITYGIPTPQIGNVQFGPGVSMNTHRSGYDVACSLTLARALRIRDKMVRNELASVREVVDGVSGLPHTGR